MAVEDLAGRVCQTVAQLGGRSVQLSPARSDDDRGGPFDLHDVDFLAHFVGAAGVERASGPDLAGQLDPASGAVDALQDDGLLALQRLDSRGESGALRAVPGRDGPYDGDEGDRDDDEGEYLGHGAEAESGDDGGGDGAH